MIREMLPEERPRERLRNQGAAALKNSELIAILLRTGTRGASSIEVAHQLLQNFGSLEGLARASVEELAKVKGIGIAKAVQLNAAFNLGARFSRSLAESQPVDSPETIAALLGDEMRMLDYECIRAISVNTKLRLLSIDEISRGSLNESICLACDVFRPALARRAYGVILVHNHPSGDPTPSQADREVTQQMKKAGDLLNIVLIDHLILGAPRSENLEPYFSFREHQLLL